LDFAQNMAENIQKRTKLGSNFSLIFLIMDYFQ